MKSARSSTARWALKPSSAAARRVHHPQPAALTAAAEALSRALAPPELGWQRPGLRAIHGSHCYRRRLSMAQPMRAGCARPESRLAGIALSVPPGAPVQWNCQIRPLWELCAQQTPHQILVGITSSACIALRTFVPIEEETVPVLYTDPPHSKGARNATLAVRGVLRFHLDHRASGRRVRPHTGTPDRLREWRVHALASRGSEEKPIGNVDLPG